MLSNSTEEMDALAGLLYLSSPALPIGAFAYSQGLESAIENDLVTDRESLTQWVQVVIEYGLMQLDIPLLNRCRLAFDDNDHKAFLAANSEVFAARESFELYEEERLLGASLYRLLTTQDMLKDRDVSAYKSSELSFLAAFSMASSALGLHPRLMRLSFVWSWLENQVAVAAKSVPIGQSDGQRILLGLRPLIVQWLVNETSQTTQASNNLPGQALLSAWHETQYSRLFRS